MTMATGGIASVISQVPFDFHAKYAIGCTFFLLNLALFLLVLAIVSLRFWLYPITFKESVPHPTESLFIPGWLISLGIILINITEYGTTHQAAGPWLTRSMFALYWGFNILAIVSSCGTYLVLWSTQTFTIAEMTPARVFPAYPLLLAGPYAGVLSTRFSNKHGLEVIIASVVLQGAGFLVSLMVYAAFLYRLMKEKLPKESLRPSMFISVGPSGFTVTGIITMGRQLPRFTPKVLFGKNEPAGRISELLRDWGLAVWFFRISAFAQYSTVRHDWWKYSFIFPNTSLCTATFAVARLLDSFTLKMIGCCLLYFP